MKRIGRILLILTLVVGLATPALAELTLNGYYRVQGTSEDFSLSKDGDTSNWVDQRFRLKMTNQLNDQVKLVYYGEVDTPWGEQSKGAIGGGGQQGADAVNIETKNVYANYKPSKMLDLTVGVQGMIDGFSDLIIDNDVAGLKAKSQMGIADLTFMWSKLYENNRANWDDEDMYALQAGFTIKEAHRIGVEVFYFDDNVDYDATAGTGGATTQIYYGLNGKFKFGKSTVSGWFLYGTEDRELDPTTSADDNDGGSWAMNLKFRQDLSKGYITVNAIYYPALDETKDLVFDDDHGTGFQFYNEGLSIFLTDIYYNNGNQAALYQNAAHNGYGLWALSAKGKVNLPKDMYVIGALGYFSAADDTAYDNAATKREGTMLGVEGDVTVGKKFSEKVDISLRGAYAMLGSFYDKTATGGADPEDPWKVVAMLNLSY